MNTKQIPEIDDIIGELFKFSSDIIDLKSAIDLKLIEQFENDFQVKLPNDYKYLLT